MNQRIEKKLSKRLVELLPNQYRDAWKCEETNTWRIGGEVDCWGEGQDDYAVWVDFRLNYHWILDFEEYPEGHEFQYMPNTKGFKPTVINLFKKIKEQAK